MQMHIWHLSAPLAIVLAVLSLHAGLCSSSTSATPPALETEHAQTAPLPKRHVLQGTASQSEFDAYAKTTSTAPFFQGTATEAMPAEWKGLWLGSVQLNELAAQSNGDKTLNGSTVNLQLFFESVHNGTGTKIFALSVHQLASQAPSNTDEQQRPQLASARGSEAEPDIHFWHTGNQSHLLIKNGAQMQIGGNMVIGGDPGTTGVVEITGHGSSLEVLPAASPRNGIDANGNPIQNVNYDGNAITTSGATYFKGHYFKSDDRISLNGAQIHTDRIDIGDRTTMTNGLTAVVSGNLQSGYLLTRLQGGALPAVTKSAPSTPTAAATRGPITLIGAREKLLGTKIIKVAPGIYDVETLTRLCDQGTADGATRQIISRYSALEPGRMTVQMTIKNFDKYSKLTDTFSTSGYLYR